jgi:hypothetical protein
MLDPKKLGLSGGIVLGVLMFLMTLLSVYTGAGKDILHLYEGLYIGYKISLIGAFIGLVYSFIKGFIIFYFLGLIYNKL